jgi:transcriptional regulator with XRE-family HTH domain
LATLPEIREALIDYMKRGSNGMMPSEKEAKPINMAIGKRVQELRKCHNITQEKLAIMLNISHRHMANIEAGTRGLTIENAKDLADIFSETLDYIYRGKTMSQNMPPICQLVANTIVHIQDEEQKDLYIDTILNLSNMMLKL